MKKIWYISKYALNPEQGGPSRQYLYSTYFAQKGYSTTLISSNSTGFGYLHFKGKYRLEEKSNFKHFILKGSKIKLGNSIKRIVSWFLFELRLILFLRKQKINSNDVVIVSSLSILTLLTGAYLKKKHGIKLIVEIRDIWPLTLLGFNSISKKNLFIKILSWIEKKGYKKADFIVGTMGNLGEHIENVAKGNKHKFRYIPMGFSNKFHKTISKSITKKKDNFIVGYAGTIGLANKVELILETAEILAKKHKNIHFEILGAGVLLDSLKEKYNHIDTIKFLPKVKKTEVNMFLTQCDILLNPWEDLHVYKYGVSPNKWIDYMYAEKPIIVPFNGFKNIIDEAKCGEFIETDNPQLFSDIIIKYSKMSKKELEVIGRRGKTYLEKNLTYEILSNKYIELFD